MLIVPGNDAYRTEKRPRAWGTELLETKPTPAFYEQLLAVNMVYYLNAMQLFAEIGIRKITDPNTITNSRIQTGIADIIQMIELCGKNFQRFPRLPVGAEEAQHCFHDLGNDICLFAIVLQYLRKPRTTENLKRDKKYLQTLILRMEHKARRALEIYESAFPGRMKGILEILE